MSQWINSNNYVLYILLNNPGCLSSLNKDTNIVIMFRQNFMNSYLLFQRDKPVNLTLLKFNSFTKLCYTTPISILRTWRQRTIYFRLVNETSWYVYETCKWYIPYEMFNTFLLLETLDKKDVFIHKHTDFCHVQM